MASTTFSWFRALVLQTHRRGQQTVDIAGPSAVSAELLAHLNFVLNVPLDADKQRQDFCLRFPSGTTLYAFVALRWYPDPAARGEHLQQSLVLLTDLPCIVLFTNVVNTVSAAIFDAENATRVQEIFSSVIADMSAWPAPASRTPMQEPPLTLKLLGRSVEPVPFAFDDTHIPGQLVYLLPISSALRACVAHLSCLWELVLLSQHILVVGPDVAATARGVLAVASVVSPLCYAGEVRPYVDTRNATVLASLSVARPCIVGVVGAEAIAQLPAPPNGWNVLWLTQPLGLSSSYSPALLSEPTPPIGFDESSDALLLRSHLIRMVADFCAPLDAFAAQQLAVAQRATTAFRIAPVSMVDSNAALEWLEQMHLPRTNPLAARKLKLYQRFFASPTFGLWRLTKLIEDGPVLVNAQLAAIKALPAQVAKLGELELVDVIIRANDAGHAAGPGPVRDALEAEVRRMLAALPYDLQQSLPATLLGTYSPTAPPEPKLSAGAKAPPSAAPSSPAAQDLTQSQSLSSSARPPSLTLKGDQAAALANAADVPQPAASPAPPVPAVVNPLQHLSKEQLRQIVTHFNNKPEAAIAAVTTAEQWRGEPEEIAAFLWTNPTLSPARVGEYLSEPKPASAASLRAYSALFHFTGKSFADALRDYLSRFRLPGEAQKIDRIMEAFAARFHACNPQAFPSADTAYVLAFSTIMLNTDAHNPQVKKKMTKREFVSNNRGIADGKDLPQAFLESLYDSIVRTPIQLNAADGLFAQAERKGWLLKQGANSVGSWQKRWFVLASNCLYYFTKPEDKDPRVIIPLEGLAVRTTNEWPGHPCFEIYEPRGAKIKSVKLGGGTGSSEGQHDKFVFEAESTADLEGWMYGAPKHRAQGIQAHVVHSPGLQLLLEKKKEISTRTTSPRSAALTTSAKSAPAAAPSASDAASTEAKLSVSAASVSAPAALPVAVPVPASLPGDEPGGVKTQT